MIKKILIVDDDRGIRESTKLLLEMEGMEVLTNPGKDVIASIYKFKPDVILLDVWMVGLDGRKVCSEIKSHTELHNPKVIMMTAGKSLRDSSLDSGADDFIEKPFDMDNLMTSITKLHH